MTSSPLRDAPLCTTCPYCGVGCGVEVRRQGATLLPVAGDETHPANGGRLCVKGSALHDTVGRGDRLLQAQVRGQTVALPQALDAVAEALRSTLETHGPDAVALYLSGQLLTEDYYVANKFFKGFVGSANVDTNSRLCMSSAVAAHVRAFGEDVVPGCYEDFELADLVVLVGSNAAWAHPVLYQRIQAARAAAPHKKLVVIDPRRTDTCADADLHLALLSGTDAWLFNGLLVYLADNDALDTAYLAEHCNGFEDALKAARTSSPDIATVAAHCGVAEADVAQFYDWFLRFDRSVTGFSQGINQSSSGTDKGNAIINCHLATGRVAKPGASPFSITGQPNAMGGREVGGLANQLAAHRGFEPEAIASVQRFWDAPHMAQKPGHKAVDMFEAIERGEIRFIWIMATNPLVSLPDADRWRRALAQCDCVVVSDCVAGTDTMAMAHIRLPAAGWGEKDGTVTNSERCISRQRQFLPLVGDAKPDWWLIAEVAQRLGHADAFAYRSARDVFVEHAALSNFENQGQRRFALGTLAELDEQAYADLTPQQWPSQQQRVFADGRFSTDDRRARLLAITPRLPVARAQPGQVLLNTGRIRDQWHTMTRTATAGGLQRHREQPYLEVHPSDAQRFGLQDAAWVRVSNPQGELLLRLQVSDAVKPGEVFAPMHWSDAFSARARVGDVIAPTVDPVSGQPELKQSAVQLAPLAVRSAGILVTAESLDLPRDFYWSRWPVAAGWVYWLAAEHDLGALFDDLSARLGSPALTLRDGGRLARAAWLCGGSLRAALLTADADAAIPSPWWLAERLGEVLAPAQRQALLTGIAPGVRIDTGRIVCTCFQVGEKTIHEAITAGCNNVDALGERLRCGSNCGSCIPELKLLLRDAATGDQAA